MEQHENKMGVMPVRRLLLSMSVPMMISMLVQALYNIVDSIFVSWVSEDALTAVTLAFPMQNLMIAFGAGTGVGVNAVLSRSLGEKNYENADKAANMGVFLAFCTYLLFLIIGLFAARPFILSQTQDTVVAVYGAVYLQMVCCLSFGLFCQVMLERLLQSTGQTFFSMISQVTGAVINLILDPILIFGWLGLPRMGVAGAALATVIGQSCAACLGLFLNLKVNKELTLSLKSVLSVDRRMIGRIYSISVPSILMMAIGSVMTYTMNLILTSFSKTATAVFGVYFKLQSFVFMPVFGLNNGLIPILAYNYGAGKKKRIEASLRFALVLAVGIMTTGTVIFEIFPRNLLAMFNASENMMEIGVPALRIICLCFPSAAFGIVMSSIFQAFAKSIYSLWVSLTRQLVVLIPAAWLLSRLGVLNYVWWAFPIAEGVSLVLSVIFFRKVYAETVGNTGGSETS